MIGRVGLARVIDARIVEDTSTEAFNKIEICQERYSAGGCPRFWINRAVHRDLRQVCEGDDVADRAAVDQWRSKPDGPAGKWEAFNGGKERNGCKPGVKDGPSPTAADVGVGIVESGAKVVNIAADGLAFESAHFIKVTGSS